MIPAPGRVMPDGTPCYCYDVIGDGRHYSYCLRARGDISIEHLLLFAREHFAEETVPPCRVCGAELTISSMGGGRATEYHCGSEASHDSLYATNPRTPIDETHYARSGWTQHHSGDYTGRRLIEVIEALAERWHSTHGVPIETCGLCRPWPVGAEPRKD